MGVCSAEHSAQVDAGSWVLVAGDLSQKDGLKVGGPSWLLGLGLSSSQTQTPEFSCPSQEASPPPPSAGSNDNLCHRWGH